MIAVPTDLSSRSLSVLPVARRLGRVTAVSVFGVPAMMLEDKEEARRVVDRHRSSRRSEVLDALSQRGCDDAEAVAIQGVPVESLAEWIDRRRPEAIVMSSHGQTGFVRLLLGSVASRLIRVSSRPVWIIHSDRAISALLADHPRILVAIDPAVDQSEALFAAIVPWAIALDAKVDLVAVAGPLGSEADDAERTLERARSSLPEAVRGAIEVRLGAPRAQIIDCAGSHDLVAVGSHTRGALGRLLLGSVSAGVARLLPAVAVIPL